MRQKCKRIIFWISMSILVLLFGCSQQRDKITVLTSIEPQNVTLFRIYPRAVIPVGKPVVFEASEPIVHDFFLALSDFKTIPTSRGHTVASWEYNWFVEVVAKGSGGMIQIAFLVPSQERNTVIGGIGVFDQTGGYYDGNFQSKLLFQWYQKYKEEWL